jgi:branched-subunit amino acid aminotransferase/4-amino-4-deoxychorismate lyase
MTVEVGINSRILHLGCFETMLGYRGKIPLIHHHFSRLQRGLDLLNWQRPDDLTVESIEDWFAGQSDPEDEKHWRVRLSVESGEERKIWTLVKQVVAHPSEPFALKSIQLTDHHNSVHEQLCKLSDRIIYKSAQKLADIDGADDALLISKDGFVSETCIAGVLLVKDGRFFTPDVQSGGLRGVGLEILKPLMIFNLLSIKERPIDLEQLKNADSVWLVNALRGPFPVKSIDRTDLNFNPDFHRRISDLFWDRIRSMIEEEWN